MPKAKGAGGEQGQRRAHDRAAGRRRRLQARGVAAHQVRRANRDHRQPVHHEHAVQQLGGGVPGDLHATGGWRSSVDTAYIATEGMLLFEQQGLVTPLDSSASKDKPAIDKLYADINPQLLKNFRNLDNRKGHTYFLPIGYNVMSIWYNRRGLGKPARSRSPRRDGRGTTSCRRRPRSRRPPTGSASPSARRHPGRSPTSIRGRSPTAPRS